MKSQRLACSVMAATIFGWLCPVAATMPLVKSRKTFPSTSSSMSPLACLTTTGAVFVPVVMAAVSRATTPAP
jgi:hypothetical protein